MESDRLIDRQIDTTENITFPATSLAGDNEEANNVVNP